MPPPDLFRPPEGEHEDHAYRTSLETKMDEVLSPFQEYINFQAIGGLLLGLTTIIALAWVSIPALRDSYYAFINCPISFSIGSLSFDETLKQFVNNVLLTLFFFFVGLEIKREFIAGELSDKKRAMFVFIAALGGMIFPAVIYISITHNTEYVNGWGIPMATDTAFAIGILTCIRQYVPKGLFSFLASLAIIDDIGAIIVIAVFYTDSLNANYLFSALCIISVLMLMNYAGFRRAGVYIILGILMWLCIEKAGVHGTLSGIIVALLIPARPRRGPNEYSKRIRKLLSFFKKRTEDKTVIEDTRQHAALEEIREVTIQATTPLQRWESRLEHPIILVVLPLFALVNAGIVLNPKLFMDVVTNPMPLGIIFGLLIGKPLGISLMAYLAVKFDIGKVPKNTSLMNVIHASFLAAIGFTMSLFIANLSFGLNDESIAVAKAAIIFASAIAAIIAIVWILLHSNREPS